MTSEESELLLRKQEGPILTLTLNKPEKLNCLSRPLIHCIMKELDKAELESSIKVIILTGGQGRSFSAGADIVELEHYFAQGSDSVIANWLRPGQALTRRIESFRKPIICAINGICFGGGCEIVEASHLAIAIQSARFSKAEIKIGIIPTFGGTQRLPRNIGRKSALELLLTGREFNAEEAFRKGLINKVVTNLEELQIETKRLAIEISQFSLASTSAILHAVHMGMDASIDDGLCIEENSFRAVVQEGSAKIRIDAFLNKGKV